RWIVPHFEKMLTDQALLVRAYLRAWQLTGRGSYLQVVRETIDFVSTALWDDGFCSSLDADAGGVEGSHITWTPDEVAHVLDAAGLDGAREVCEWYGITGPGNFDGRSIPHRPPGAQLERPHEIEVARRALLDARLGRLQPTRDDKVLTEWNAMFIAALAEAASATADDAWASRAGQAAELLFQGSRRADGRWMRARSGDVPAFAADYAWLVECCCKMAELTGRSVWGQRAEEIGEAMLDLFADDHGTLRTVGRDSEVLYIQPLDFVDGAVPSANAIGAQALVRAGALTGSRRLSEAGERIVERARRLAASDPIAVADLLPAIAMAAVGVEIVVSGERPDLRDVVRRHWRPDAVFAWGEPAPSPLWEGKQPGRAYVCRHFSCLEPAADAEVLESQLLRVVAGHQG
ncbi:MAG: thioredoxin domain-containing protein, partial [Acidimicrobiales bacterium]